MKKLKKLSLLKKDQLDNLRGGIVNDTIPGLLRAADTNTERKCNCSGTGANNNQAALCVCSDTGCPY